MLETAMIFGAGFGTRMGALTKERPKPMIEVAGKPLIDHALGFLRAGGVKRIVVNTHYKAEMLEAHLASHADVVTIREMPDILETGGGLRNALPLLGKRPILTLNADIIWYGLNPIEAMRGQWDAGAMDALLLVLPVAKAIGYSGDGDFKLHKNNRLSRATDADYVYSGLQIINPVGIQEIKEKSFSINKLWDVGISKGRVSGLKYSEGWLDVGKQENIAEAEAILAGDHD